MDMKLPLIIGAIVVASIGLGAVLLLNKSGDDMRGAITVAEIAVSDEAKIPEHTQAQQDFQSMAVDAELPDCRVPRPPNDLARSPYIRNGYAAIRKIMAMQRWQKTDSCECFADQISWAEAVAEAKNYVTSDNPILPFDVVALQKQGDEIAARRREVCGN